MATQDARISTALPGHPKTKKLAKRLGLAACWHLVCLFLWTAANRSDGSLAGMTDEDVELAADWNGADGAFVAAIKAVGFLDGDEGAYEVHHWAKHNPWAAGADARSEKSRFAALCKQHGRLEASRMMPEYAARFASGSEQPSAGMPEAPAGGASGMPVAGSSFAPFPFPSPSPSPPPSPKQEPRARCALELPEWVPAEAWADWHTFRQKATPKRWGAKAQQLSLSTLVNLHTAGHAPRAVIEQSIERGWTGLFPLKEERIHAHRRNFSLVERMRAHAIDAEQRGSDAVAQYGPAYALAADG